MKSLLLFITSFFCYISVFAQPTNNAPTPPMRNAVDVISIYGGAYTNITDVNYNPFWGQTGAVNTDFDPGTGDLVMAYTNFNYQGTGFEANAQNASAMEFIHIDIWTSTATDVKFSPIDNSGSGVGEFLVSVPLISGQWSSVDLPKSAFEGMTWNSVFQLKFDGQGGVTPSDIYLDNIYFWKTATNAGSDATLSELLVDGVSVPGFAPSALNYTYGVPGGGAIPQITGATTSDAAAMITMTTQATSIPGDATVSVLAADGTTTATYTVSYFYNSPNEGAPDPKHVDVISLFSDAYTNVMVDFWNTSWSQATYEATEIAGNPTHKYTNVGFNGIETTTNPIDASAMKFLHMDVWTPNITVFNMKLVSFLGDGFGGANGDSEANIDVPLTPYIWNQITLSLDDFKAAGLSSLADLNQYIFTSTPFGPGIVYIDNMYFSTGTTSTVDVENAISLAYPNPVLDGQVLSIQEDVASMELFNLNGQLVSRSQGNSMSIINIESGLYMLRVTDKQDNSFMQKIVVK